MNVAMCIVFYHMEEVESECTDSDLSMMGDIIH